MLPLPLCNCNILLPMSTELEKNFISTNVSFMTKIASNNKIINNSTK